MTTAAGRKRVGALAENIAADLKAPPGSSMPANKRPFDEDELRIYAACDAITAMPARRGELIGDTEAIVRKHYSKWVVGRQERLTRILKDEFGEIRGWSGCLADAGASRRSSPSGMPISTGPRNPPRLPGC